MSVQPEIKYTPYEYLAMERQAEEKSEYFDGEIFAMTGASRKHNLISLNTGASIHRQLRKRDCEVYTNDMRVKVSPTGLYTYPDVVAVCDEPRFDDSHNDTLINPNVIVEVLSESTESYDRGRKFENYRSLESLKEYILIHQDKIHVEHYIRKSENSWLFKEYKKKEDEVIIDAIKCKLKLEEIYEKVETEEANK